MSGGGKGLILKGAAEKPTLVAKPPGPPTPVKSPWAPLPPVDKITPISADLQQAQQSQQSRFMQRDPHAFESMPPTPAKEIAADDFSRSWRDGNNISSTNRELFNSQSGRYEPVNDSRRGSSRNDMHSRQPALLQRPSHQDQPEPSAAFQTHRASGQEAGYGRRRTSSNVSGGSGNFARRMSKGQEMLPPHELFGARRGSLVATSEDPSSPRNYSPSGNPQVQRSHQQQWQARASPVISHASPTSTHGQIAVSGTSQPSIPGLPLEDEVELQKKIMRETRELARKRRLEEEAKEEAEKKERIRLKLEAMGPPPETKKTKKETPKEEKAVPTHIQTRDSVSNSLPPPKPPVAEVAGEIKQYGMMKVHPPESVSLTSADHTSVSEATRPLSQGSRPNGIHHESAEVTASSQQLPGDSRQSQTWQSSAPSGQDRFSSSTWANPTGHATQGRNVWGPPSNDRTLGNGTFNPELSLHGSQSSQMASTGPGPIGPPNPNRTNGGYQGRAREQYGQRPAPIGPPHRLQGVTRQDLPRAQANLAWNALPEKLAEEDVEKAKQATNQRDLQESSGDASLSQPVFKDTWRQVSLGDDGTRSGIQSVSHNVNDPAIADPTMAWKDFPSKLVQDEAAERAMLEQQAAVRRQLEASGLRKDVAQPVYKDTWRQVQLENGVRSDVLGSSTVNSGTSATSSPAVRGSRFFPQSRDVRLEDPNTSFVRPGSPSPPPPTMAGHPAYDGDISHPHVHLPHWPPVVKLPPPKILAPIGPPKPAASFAAAAATPSASTISSAPPSTYHSRQQDVRYPNEAPSRPAIGPSGGDNWQDRINHLIGRKTSPPKTHALAVDSSSKHALELPSSQMSATVSLPGSITGNITEDDGAVESKPMAEECFEEQEMGSLPNIRVPNKAPEAAWQLAPPPSTKFSRKFALSNITSSESFVFSPQITNNGFVIHIMIPGMTDEKCANIQRSHEPRQKSNGRRSGVSRGGPSRHASSSHLRGGRPRDTSSSFPSPKSDSGPASPSPNSSSRGGARGRGGYTGTWNTHRNTPTPSSAINV